MPSQPSSKRTVGAFLVELLAANGIDTVFGIPGVHTLELYRGLAASSMRHVLARHEQGAGFAADGYARASGRVAAAFVISGPGLTNILTAAGQAHSDSVPFLVIASTPMRASLGKRWGVLHELEAQRALAAQVFGFARSAGSAEELRDQMRAAFAWLRGPRARPAYIDIPLDALAEFTELETQRFARPFAAVGAPQEGIQAAARLLNDAQRPIIIAGGGARGCAAELARVVDILDAPLATTAAGKGLIAHTHRAHLGASLPFAQTQALIAGADAVLAVGTELSETDVYTTARLPLGGALIRIDVDAAKLADQYGAEIALCGDARLTLDALARELAALKGELVALAATAPKMLAVPLVSASPLARNAAAWAGGRTDAAAHREAIEADFDELSRARQRALLAVRSVLPADGLVFSDMTQIAYLGNFAFPTDVPGTWLHPSGYGTLGYALPAAVGAKIAAPSRAVIALAGDFGIQFSLNELMTAVEERLSLPIIVWNNSALGQIRADMHGADISAIAVVAKNPDFVALARACGADGIRVHGPAQLAAALERALHADGPTMIEAVEVDFLKE